MCQHFFVRLTLVEPRGYKRSLSLQDSVLLEIVASKVGFSVFVIRDGQIAL